MDLVGALKPFFVVFQLYGLTTYKIVRSGRTSQLVPSYFLNLYSRFVYLCIAFWQAYSLFKHIGTVTHSNSILAWMVSSVDVFTLAINILLGKFIILQYSPEMYHELNNWNEFQFENLQIRKPLVKNTRALVECMSIFHFTYPVLLWLLSGLWEDETYLSGIGSLFFYYFDGYIMGTIVLKFLVCIAVIGMSYVKVNYILKEELSMRREAKLANLKDIFHLNIRNVRTLMKADQHLKDLEEKINEAFGPIAATSTLLYFVESLYSTSHLLLFNGRIFSPIMWFIYMLIQLFTMCAVCKFASSHVSRPT